MSTVRVHSTAVQFRNTTCPRCGAAATGGATCGDCLMGQAEFECRKLKADLADLVNGCGVFRPLSVTRRGELLADMGFTPESVAPLMDDAALIDIVADPRSSEDVIDAASAELARRLG